MYAPFWVQRKQGVVQQERPLQAEGHLVRFLLVAVVEGHLVRFLLVAVVEGHLV
jgi:hypothetical protein